MLRCDAVRQSPPHGQARGDDMTKWATTKSGKELVS